MHKLYEMAGEENDYPLKSLLLWFIDEYVKEEEAVHDIIDKLTLIGGNGSGLYLLNRRSRKDKVNIKTKRAQQEPITSCRRVR
ncbi:MAG TPA: ferritin-like domain-containing protein [Fodinibius sp.]|nr:ferritin-like domain-containing protein [Fodinibius sp.]